MPARPKTLNRGAADTIARVITKVRRMMLGHTDRIDGDELVAWLKDWDKRAGKKAGGLGRK